MMFLDKYKSIMQWFNQNQRNIENSKTVLLWILVVSSLLLTLSLWRYNPDYDALKEQGSIESIEIETNGSKKLNEVVRPIQIIYYHGGKNYFPIADEAIRNDIYDQLLESIMVNQNTVTPSRITELKDPNHFIELVFPSKLSESMIEHLFNIDKKAFLISDIERVYIYKKNEGDVLRLISYSKNNFVDLEVQLDYEYFSQKIEDTGLNNAYFNHYVRNEHGIIEDVIYLPTTRVEISPPIKIVQKVEPEDFKLALFNDPASVNREESNNKIYYSSDKQVLSISLETFEMSYRSIITDVEARLSDYERVKKSVEFVNNHYGWTDEYVLFDGDKNGNKSFRLMVDGIPVLNNNDLGLIELSWDRGQVYEYKRSLINLYSDYKRNSFPEKMNEKVDPTIWPSLMSGYDVLGVLEQTNKLNSVKDIKIGFKMQKYNNNSSFYEFIPSWYYYNGEYWTPIVDELGGEADGLEEN
jgi:regulatory protein YycH of two-component signal transduction system YycFG